MNRPNQVYIGIKGTHMGESAKAVKFSINEIEGEVFDPPKTEWFPFSQITRIFKDPNSVGNDSLMASEWLCKQKGLI